MLKRKSGNTPGSTPTKLLRSSKPKFPISKYAQSTISQAFYLVPKAQEPNVSSLHPHAYGIISSHLKDYKSRLKGKSLKSFPEKSFLIQGPQGSGRTHLIRQLSTEFQLKVLELNVSSSRNKANILKTLGEASQTFTIKQGENTGVIIFIDDVDVVLESDQGFFSGIESICTDCKCPVLMTCVEVPRKLRQKNLKICRLTDFKFRAMEILKTKRNLLKVGFSDKELECLYERYQGNLNAILNSFYIEDFQLAYGSSVEVKNSGIVSLKDAFGVIADRYERKSKIDASELGFKDCTNMVELLENFQQIDLLDKLVDDGCIEAAYRTNSYLNTVEKLFLKQWNDTEEYNIKCDAEAFNFHKIIREHTSHMSETVDFISYFQFLKSIRPNWQYNCLASSSSKATTELDLFFQKNPNQFRTTP